jgi:hypothetical protein
MVAAYAPGDSNRLFVARVWDGDIRVVDLATRSMLTDPFLKINDLPSPLGNEQGLLGLAFDPDFATNGYFYVNSTGPDNSLSVRRYRVLGDPATSNVADPNSGHTILHLPRPFSWHNGGWIGFGPHDGYLYVNHGDPGGGNAQDVTDNLYGKVLRIDVRDDDFPEDPQQNYAIPPTNPFVGKDGDDEIWALGLRNPWQSSFDRATGDLWINDVGENLREEVNYQPAGKSAANYGWPHREGSLTAPFEWGEPPSPKFTEPAFDYTRDDPDPLMRGTVIGGGQLYRGPVAALNGHYLFGDYGNGNIWKLDPDAVDPRASVTNITSQLLANAHVYHQIPAFGEDADGNVYLIINYDEGHGEIRRVATRSQDIVWNGDDALWGEGGDGSAWGSALNWTRGDSPDAPFIAEDNVIFAPSSLKPHIFLGRDRTVAAVTFHASYTLHDHTLKVLSGNVIVDRGVTATIASTLSAETVHHSIRKLGAGTLLVEGHAGQTAVKEGTLGGTGSLDHLTVRKGGTVAPGVSTGVLTVLDSFTMEPGATLAIDFGGRSNSDIDHPQFDQLLIEGTARLAGTLDVTRIDLGSGIFVPRANDAFQILTAAGGISGWFDALDLPALPADLKWRLDSNGFVLSLKVVSLASRLHGDFNDDGTVDAADYIVWRNTRGQSGSLLDADGTGPNGTADGMVNTLDYELWRSNFGTTQSAAGQALVVCGPHSIRLVLIGMCILFPNIRRMIAL